VLAVTGGMSAGKSALASILRREGASYLSLDELAHSLYEPGKPLYQPLIRAFGRGILGVDGAIDRGKLGRLVFTDPHALARLDGLVHPVLRREAGAAVTRMKRLHRLVVVETGPLLFRLGLNRLVDGAVLVGAGRRERLARLMSGRGLSRADAMARLDASKKGEINLEKGFGSIRRRMAVDASGGPERLEAAAVRILGAIKRWK